MLMTTKGTKISRKSVIWLGAVQNWDLHGRTSSGRGAENRLRVGPRLLLETLASDGTGPSERSKLNRVDTMHGIENSDRDGGFAVAQLADKIVERIEQELRTAPRRADRGRAGDPRIFRAGWPAWPEQKPTAEILSLVGCCASCSSRDFKSPFYKLSCTSQKGTKWPGGEGRPF